MNKTILILAGLCFIVAFTRCSTVRVLQAEGTDQFSLSEYKTYNFYQPDVDGDSIGPAFSAQVDMLKMEVAREMEQHGLKRDTANPELLVNLGITVEDKVQTRETNIREAPIYIGQRRYSWRSTEVPVGRYKKGMFALDLVDPADNKMVWQGKVEGIVPDKISELQEAISEGVTKLFERMPDAEESSM